MTFLIYAVDCLIVGTYLLLVLGRVHPIAFDYANGAGGIALVSLTLLTVGWVPILALTIAFTVFGWIGVWRKSWHAAKHPTYASIALGMKQAARGDIVDLGSFRNRPGG